MKNFYFRTNLGKSTGIGNYMRVSRLAAIFEKGDTLVPSLLIDN